jgi:hypothetical protein
MAQAEQSRTFRSLAIYGLLLELYPRPYLQQHRAEMLQDFQEVAQTLPSKAGLWRETSPSVFGLNSSRRFGDRPQSLSSFLLFCSRVQSAVLWRTNTPLKVFVALTFWGVSLGGSASGGKHPLSVASRTA